MSGWISVKDKLPEKRGSYLTFCVFRNGETEQKIKLWTPSLGFTSQPRAVTHWMELPKAPEPEGVSDEAADPGTVRS